MVENYHIFYLLKFFDPSIDSGMNSALDCFDISQVFTYASLQLILLMFYQRSRCGDYITAKDSIFPLEAALFKYQLRMSLQFI